MFLTPILVVAVIMTAAFFIAYMLLSSENRSKGKALKLINKSHNDPAALKEAETRLRKNPNDAAALLFIGEHWFDAEKWDKAFKNYELLSSMPNIPPGIDQSMINMRAAICALNLDMLESAFKYALVAHTINPKSFEILYELGNIEFLRGNYEKALGYLKKSYAANADYVPALRLLGHTYFKLEQSKEALDYIRKSLELAPNDKASLFTLAECYTESGQREHAERIYSHLRPDPFFGPEACLRLGILHTNDNQDDAAIEDFKIGLKHRNMRPEISTELQYQLGTALLRKQKITDALAYLQHVQAAIKGYKDTDSLVEKYKEMNTNKNLQIFCMAPSGEFVTLCRRIVLAYYPKARVKITKTQMNDEWADIVAEIDTQKWSDVAMFRFIRTQGAVGEMVLRDFQFNLKKFKAGKGICLGVCHFSDEAKRFTEARLIDLIEKERFLNLLKTIDAQNNE
jgi:tetratricopeptide (TPR) repeat protein